jgi:hypothetical protein
MDVQPRTQWHRHLEWETPADVAVGWQVESRRNTDGIGIRLVLQTRGCDGVTRLRPILSVDVRQVVLDDNPRAIPMILEMLRDKAISELSIT